MVDSSFALSQETRTQTVTLHSHQTQSEFSDYGVIPNAGLLYGGLEMRNILKLSDATKCAPLKMETETVLFAFHKCGEVVLNRLVFLISHEAVKIVTHFMKHNHIYSASLIIITFPWSFITWTSQFIVA